VYSPRISEALIPELYVKAKERGLPMTRLVDWIIRNALSAGNLPESKHQGVKLQLYVCEGQPRDAA
jgi:hypothetical protein